MTDHTKGLEVIFGESIFENLRTGWPESCKEILKSFKMGEKEIKQAF